MERNPLRELRVWMAEHLTAQIETARRLLERTMQSMDEIADCCGFGSADVLASAFTRVLQVTPGEYRSRAAPRASKNRLGLIRRNDDVVLRSFW